MKQFVFIVLFILSLAAGCSSESSSKLEGKWQAADADFDLEFLNDGTCIYREPFDGSFSCNYKAIDNERIKVSISIMGASFIVRIINDETIEVSYSQQEKVVFKRKS